MMNTEKDFVKTFLRNANAHFSDTWLMSCIEWLKTECLGTNYSPQELQAAVLEQWLLSDLRDIEIPSFPSGLTNKNKYILNGNYCAQILQIIDISKPKLWQIQKIRNSNALTRDSKEDTEVAGSGKRMLQLTLSDGVQDVEAVEYKSINCLNLNLPPGVKVSIIGPVSVRRGRIMLEERNIKILGGEIESLLVQNAPENVLARALNLPENPNPFKVEEKLLSTVHEENDEGYTRTRQIPQPPRIALVPEPPPIKPSTPKAKASLFELEDDDDSLSHELDVLLETEAEVRKETQTARKMKTPDLFDDSDIEAAFENLESIVNLNKTLPSNNVLCEKPGKLYEKLAADHKKSMTDNKTTTMIIEKPVAAHFRKTSERREHKITEDIICVSDDDSPVKDSTSQVNNFKNMSHQDNFANDDDFALEHFDFNEALSSTQKPMATKVTKILEPKIISIENFLKLQHQTTKAMFYIKAKFKKVIEKLSFEHNEYKITIKVEDSSNEVTVRLHSDIISEYAGYTPTEILALKNRILQNDEDAKDKVMGALEKLRLNLIKIDNVMAIQVEKNMIPVIVKIV